MKTEKSVPKEVKTFLVTGVAGFIGAALVRKLLLEGHRVVGVDNLSTGNLVNVPREVTFIEGDAHEARTINQLYAWEFDGLFHIAGQSAGEVSFDNPTYDLQSNCQSTLLLLELARRTHCKTFIYASTMAVYGDPEDPSSPVNETSRVFPKSFYAVGKVASESYMRIYSEVYGLNCTALRLFNVYGPGQNMNNPRQGMVSIFLAAALAGGQVLVKGSGERFRDQVFIDDAVDAFELAFESASAFNAFNIATGKKTSVNDVLGLLKKNGFTNPVSFSGKTLGDQVGIYGDSQKFREKTGWEAKISFEEGFQEMVNYCVAKKRA